MATLPISSLTPQQNESSLKPLFQEFVPQEMMSQAQFTKEALLLCNLGVKLVRRVFAAVQKGTLSELDALVGDAACHIRAIVIASIAQENLFNKELHSALCIKSQKIQRIASSKLPLTTSLQELMKNEDLKDIFIDSRIILLAQAALLGHAKALHPVHRECRHCSSKDVPTIAERTEEGRITSIQKGISIAMQKKLVEATKRVFSKKCCQALQSLGMSAIANTTENEALLKCLYREKVINGRTEISVSSAVDALLYVAAHRSIPILIKSMPYEHTPENPKHPFDLSLIFMAGTGGKGRLYLHRLDSIRELSAVQPIVVIEGQRSPSYPQNKPLSREDSLISFLREDVAEILRANAACHPQFSDGSSFEEIEKSLQKLKVTALNKGFCEENQRVFAIKHIFTSTFKEQSAFLDSSILFTQDTQQ